MLDSVEKYIQENGLFLPEDRILLAVSGGIDSMVMADVFIKRGYRIGIAHCNFSLRGEESNKDERLVEDLAAKHQLPFYSIRFNTKEYAKEHSISIQMAARTLRYEWFGKLCKEHSFRYISTAHNLDDKVETFFLNLARGTGVKGLSGMPPKNGNIIHPILFVSRKEIEAYAEANNVAYREDETNATTYYARNRIRHNVIPELFKINPSFYHTMDENMERLLQVEELLEQSLASLRHEACSLEEHVYTVKIEQLKKYQPLPLFLFEILYPLGFTDSTIKDIERCLHEQSGKQFFSLTHQLVKNREELLIFPIHAERDEEYRIFQGVDEVIQPITLSIELSSRSSIKSLKINSDVAYINADKLVFPLLLRKWKKGDVFIPFGMKGKKKLSDFFIDSKLSLLAKQQQWVLVSNNDIVWVVGHRIDDRYRVDESTEKVLKLTYKN